MTIEKYLNRYRSLSKPLKASFWFMVCSVLQKGISILTMPLFARLLTKAEYGEYNLYYSWLSIFTILGTLQLYLGVYNTTLVKIDSEEERDQLTFSLQSLSSTITVITFLVWVCLRNVLEPFIGLSAGVMALMFATIFFTPALNFWSNRQRFKFKYTALIAVTLSMSLLNPLLGFALLNAFSDKGLSRIVSVAIVDIAVGAFFYIRNCRHAKLGAVTKYWRNGLRFNLPLLPHYISNYILSQSDRAMIGAICGNAQVAMYSVGCTIGGALTLITSSINNTYTPWAFTKMKDKNYSVLRRNSNYLVMLVGLASLVIIAVAPELLMIFGANYAEAVWCIPPIILGCYCTFLYSLFANIEFYFEETKFIMMASTAAAILNIALNAWLIPKFGYVAAAYTTVFSYFMYSIFHAAFAVKICRREIPGKKVYNIRFIFGFTLLLMLCSAALTLTYRHTVFRYVLIAAALLAAVPLGKNFYFWLKKSGE